MSNPVLSFVREHDFSGKKVAAFWTFVNHDENYERDIRKELGKADYLLGLPLSAEMRESDMNVEKNIGEWLKYILSHGGK